MRFIDPLRYKNAKIYKLICSLDNTFYIGSTVQDLETRFTGHYYHARNLTSKMYKHFDEIGWENVSIELIQEINCNSKIELQKLEYEYINNAISDPKCLNTRKA